MPEIEELATELAGRATVYKLDLTLFFDKQVQKELNITSLPTYIIYKDGREIRRLSGPKEAKPPKVRDAVTAALEM